MWRFPYLCHRNGGGDFILLYFLLLFLFGIPLLYMEMVMGQWLRVDSIRIWKHLVPLLGGLGYVSMLAHYVHPQVCIIVSMYNSVIISWSFYYLGNSFYHPLPWTQCPVLNNVTGLSCVRTVPYQYFWYETTLNAPVNIEEGSEHLVLNLTVGTLGTWLLLFIIIITGLKLSMPRSSWTSLDLWHQAGGHVLYSLGLGLGTTINICSYKAGSNNCILVVLVAMANLVTSLVATAIIFTVLGLWITTSGQACVEKSVLLVKGMVKTGVLPKNVNPPPDILLLPPLDYLKWIDSLPEHLKYKVMQASSSCSIEMLSKKFMQGPGLAFPAFSQAISTLPGAPFWAFLFFLVLLLMQLTTLVKIVESIVYPIHNALSTISKQPTLLPVVICLGGFLGSIVFTSRSGSYIMSLLDETLVPLTLFIIAVFQNGTLAWVYGAYRFREEMYSELGRLLWSACPFLWCYVTMPGLLAFLSVCLVHLYRKVPPHYIAWNSSMSQEVEQPYLQSSLGWITFLSVVVLLPIPIYPLQRWWYLQDHVASDPFAKFLSKKSMVPTKPSDWPKYHLAKPSFQESSLVRSSMPRESNPDPEWPPEDVTWSQRTESYSGFSLPFVSSLPSAVSISPPTSKQGSVPSTGVNSERRKTRGESLHTKFAQ
ncbi:Orphan sodium- and chloride-dependent neurotransmitter transporter NTT5 [Myotis brandtii]|uniref:Transporter n=1 Tax=Myotis brandtii TaxID=109478 RepID=S7PYF1_MYOBR|nr:Orphan sodium- and chloride-dependent neurotransmitter transporter NTT5 [Myotis brandtii]